MFYFCWPNVGSTLLHQQTLSRNSWHGKMLAQRWANCALPRNSDHMFYLCWPNVGPTLSCQQSNQCAMKDVLKCWPNVGPTLCAQRQPSTNGTTKYQRWPNVVMLSGYGVKHAYSSEKVNIVALAHKGASNKISRYTRHKI